MVRSSDAAVGVSCGLTGSEASAFKENNFAMLPPGMFLPQAIAYATFSRERHWLYYKITVLASL